ASSQRFSGSYRDIEDIALQLTNQPVTKPPDREILGSGLALIPARCAGIVDPGETLDVIRGALCSSTHGVILFSARCPYDGVYRPIRRRDRTPALKGPPCPVPNAPLAVLTPMPRSEERRVGKECRL